MTTTFNSYQEYIDLEISAKYQADIPEAIKRAYKSVDLLMDDVGFLKTPGAQNSKGHLIQNAVEFQLMRLIETGIWPFDFHWENFAKPTGKYLQILPKNTVITVNRLQKDSQFPRNAKFRNNQRLNNDPQQFQLFNDDEPEESEAQGRPHLILGHGYHEPTFAHIYIPHSQYKIWNWSTRNLFDLPYSITSDIPPVERPATKGEPEIKEEFKEWLLKNERNRNNN
jgi:hypothetical protein